MLVVGEDIAGTVRLVPKSTDGKARRRDNHTMRDPGGVRDLRT